MATQENSLSDYAVTPTDPITNQPLSKQSTKTLGDLYYYDAPRPFVEAPVAQMRQLAAQKENDYLVSQETANMTRAALDNLKSRPQSDAVRQQLEEHTKKLDQINSSNYATNVLNVKQFAFDFKNKFGADKLALESKQLAEAQATYDKAFADGTIKDPAYATWLKEQTNTNSPGLTIGEDGTISHPNIKPKPFSPFVDGQKMIDDYMKGWQANKFYDYVPGKPGMVKILQPIHGLIQYKGNTEVREEDVRAAASKLLMNDQGYINYAKDYADFKANTQYGKVDGNLLNTLLTPEEKETYFGSPDASVYGMQNAIDNKTVNAQGIVKAALIRQQIQGAVGFATDKASFNLDEVNVMRDMVTENALKEMAKGTDSGVGAGDVVSAANLTKENFDASSATTPLDTKVIDTEASKVNEDIKNKKLALIDYKTNLNKELKEKGKLTEHSYDEIKKQNEALALLDQRAEELIAQKKGLRTSATQLAWNNGIVVKDRYTAQQPAALKEAVRVNRETLLNESSLEVDITDRTVTKGGITYFKKHTAVGVNTKENFFKGLPNVQQWKEELIPINKLPFISKNGNSYILKRDVTDTEDDGTIREFMLSNNILSDGKFNTNGSPNTKIKILTPEVKDKIYRTPTQEQYEDSLVEAFQQGTSSTNLGFISKSFHVDDNKKLIIGGNVLSTAEELKKIQPELDPYVSVPEHYLAVTGATSKDVLYEIQKDQDVLNKAFRGTATTTGDQSQYSVIDKNGALMPFGDVLTKQFGLPNISSTYVDWAKTDIKRLLEANRVHGQMYGSGVVLTEKGKEAFEKHDSDAFKAAYAHKNVLPLTLVNTATPSSEEKARVKHLVMSLYNGLAGRTDEDAVNLKKNVGLMYANQLQEGADLDNLNLYTMGAGENLKWKVRGNDYLIGTTAKAGNNSEISNTNFHLRKVTNNKLQVLAKYTDTTGKQSTAWVEEDSIKEGGAYNKVDFDSPNDLKAFVGATLAQEDYLKQGGNPNSGAKAVLDLMDASFYTPAAKVEAKELKQDYKTPVDTTLFNHQTGKDVTFRSYRKSSDLVDYSENPVMKGRIQTGANGVMFPVIDKEVAPNLYNLMNTYKGLNVSGGFRGIDTHSNLEASNKTGAKDSTHKYGNTVDLEDNEASKALMIELKGNPAKMKELGISGWIYHSETKGDSRKHLHIQFSKQF